MLNLFKSAGFRLAVVLSLCFSALSILMFGFIYFKSTDYQLQRTDAFLVGEIGQLASQPEAALIQSIGNRRTDGVHRLTISALFSSQGVLIAGNLRDIPNHLRLDGRPHTEELDPNDTAIPHRALIRSVATKLPDGTVLVLGRSLDDLVELRQAVAYSLMIGLAPTVLLTLGLSAIVAWRTLRWVQAIDMALDRIIKGELGERLPTRGTRDSLDRLVVSVNGILDKISILIEELRDIGGNIAHDLRTPLARVRARLERGLNTVPAGSEAERTIELALCDLDHSTAIISALLRIGEIQDQKRRAEFSDVSLAALVEELFDGYQPVAENQNITLSTQVDPTMHILADWDLMTEALSNLVENALKYTPSGGTVRLLGFNDDTGGIIRVADNGPGINKADHDAVFTRFYRGNHARAVSGSGIGLSLVHAICRLHGYTVAVVDGPPGCVIDIRCGKVHRELSGLSALTTVGNTNA